MSFSTDAAYTAAKMAGVEEAFAAAMKAAIAARAADPLAFIGQQLLTLSAESKRQAIEHVPRSSAARTHWRTAAAAAAAMHRPRTVSISRRPSTAVVESAPAASLTIGTVAKLGEGTSGQAFLVANEWDAREYCLKVVPLTDAAGRAEAANEARLHASVSHAACVRYCYSWLGEDDTCCVLMELCDKDLWACLEASEASEQLALPRQRWSRDLAGALAHVHALGIVHRDLNPWNVFVTKQLEAKLGDFGLSVRMPEGGELSGREAPGAAPLDESAIGSLYSAPELGGETYGFAADVYSLGMTLFAAWATLTTPLDTVIDQVERLHTDGTPPEGFDATVCPFAELILRMVAHEPGARPTAGEVVRAIDAER